MSLGRQVLAVFLSIFLASPVLATEKPKKNENGYPYFKLGVRPINSSGTVNWDRECVVTTTEDSPPVRMYYKSSDGFVKLSAFGIIRAPEDIVVNAKTGFALYPRVCRNGIADPTDWVPVGVKKCAEVAKTETPAANTFKPFTMASPEYGWGIKPDEPKKLDFNTSTSTDSERAKVSTGGADNEKSPTWPYWVGGGAGVALALILIFSKKDKGDPKSTGGPAGDPSNSVLSYSW